MDDVEKDLIDRLLIFLNEQGGKIYRKEMTEKANQAKEVWGGFRTISERVVNAMDEYVLTPSKTWQNSGRFHHYYWTQYKMKGFEDNPSSISLFVAKEDDGTHFIIKLTRDQKVDAEHNESEFKQKIDRHNNFLHLAPPGDKSYYYTRDEKKITYEELMSMTDSSRNMYSIHLEKRLTYSTKETAVDDFIKDILKEFKVLERYYKYNLEEKRGSALELEELVNQLKENLLASKNIILRGAPGTGKTFLAKKIAAGLIESSEEELIRNEQFGFVQFHPSYDYTDFVEGLRTKNNENGQLSFELTSGTFMNFCKKAKKEWEDTELTHLEKLIFSEEDISSNKDIQCCWNQLIKELQASSDNRIFIYDGYEEGPLLVELEERERISFAGVHSKVGISNIKNKLLEPEKYPDAEIYWRNWQRILKYTMKKCGLLPKFVFVIDEINRGEISKIFGELFFSVDPSYRGEKGAVATQYAAIHEEGHPFKHAFFIPENVYIIGTMNDIDRSVESFDFALRRRFRFIEIAACAPSQLSMLDGLTKGEEAKRRLIALNQKINEIEGLNSNYHIGASYFTNLSDINDDFDVLWSDYLYPLLQEYVCGFRDEQLELEKLYAAYCLKTEDAVNENS